MRIHRRDFTNLVDDRAAFHTCWWPVAGNYKIAGGWIYPDGGWDLSFPLKDPGLFLSFARLGAYGDPSNSSILRWVSKHGLLLRDDDKREAWNNYWWEADPDKRFVGNQAPMKLEDFVAEVRRAMDLLNLYTELQSQDYAAIEARATNPKTAMNERLNNHLQHTAAHDGGRKPYKAYPGRFGHEWEPWTAADFFADEITASVSNVKLDATIVVSDIELFFSRINEEDNTLFKPPYALKSVWHCPDLLPALYLQFYLLVTEHRPMRHCENPACMMTFPVTRTDKRFCNSTCRSNARNYPKP